MANLYSDEYTQLNHPENRPVANTVDKQVRTIVVNYTMTGTEAAADLIYLAPLPAGAEVKKTGTYTQSVGTVAATATLDVGDDDATGDGDRYVDGANVAAAGVDAMSLEPNYVTTDNCNLTATFATLSTPNEGGVIKFYVTYLAPN